MAKKEGITKKEIKDTVLTTIDEVFKKMNRINWIDRHKAMQEEAFKNTEILLYGYEALKEHLKNEDEYMDMAFHGKSKSITSYVKGGFTSQTDDEIMAARLDSYNRSVSDVKRIEQAINAIKDDKGYEIIKMRYFEKSSLGETYTWEEIAEWCAGKYGFSENLNEKTVRNIKNKLIKQMSIIIFGSDAL